MSRFSFLLPYKSIAFGIVAFIAGGYLMGTYLSMSHGTGGFIWPMLGMNTPTNISVNSSSGWMCASGSTNCMGDMSSMHAAMGHTMAPSTNTTGKALTVAEPNAPQAKQPENVYLKNGDTYAMTISDIKKTIAGHAVDMLAYNGSIPGPVLHAPKGASITLKLTNNVRNLPATLHSHGVRLEDTFDGVPMEQGGKTPTANYGQTVDYTIRFPDAGTFWYHPHIRDDAWQEFGLTGMMVVSGAPSGYPEEYVTLDDILLGKDGNIVPFSQDVTDHALMGRYGNVFLVNGQEQYQLTANWQQVRRFYLANVANARTFALSFSGAKMKLVGSDQGEFLHQTFTDRVVIGPAERYVMDVYFDTRGTVEMLNTTPEGTKTLGKITVGEPNPLEDVLYNFGTLDENEPLKQELKSLEPWYAAQPTKRLSIGMSMPGMEGMGNMHMMPTPKDGMEWEDTMPAMNAAATNKTLTWKLRDEDTGKENMDIAWKFAQGERVKLRVSNSADIMHPMQHPFHIHGQRFLVLATNGKRETNPVWKDTVLIPAGTQVDLLVEMDNPGKWMMHCHIVEHLHSGMMMGFEVEKK